ncbi:MAG: ABC transporter permease [Anaerolineae bacterium]|nr:ABC transporter permease [Anaerolineae bacterium]
MKRIRPSVFNVAFFWLAVGLMYLPILLLVIFSFNDSTYMVFPLKSFTLKWYDQLLGANELLRSLYNSLLVGFFSSLIATILGAMGALAMTRFQFKGKGAFLALSTVPMIIPYVVLGVAMMILFRAVGIPLTLWTVAIGHVVINIPYNILIVSARLAGFDASLEEAAMDLGANYWQTLQRVYLPIIMPALVAAFLSSFVTSFNEFALAFFLTGRENTLQMYLYSQLRFPSRLPLVVTLASITMVGTILVMVLAEWLRRFGRPGEMKGEPSHD